MADGDEIILPDGRVLPLKGRRTSPEPVTASEEPCAMPAGNTRDRRRRPRSDTHRGGLFDQLS